MAKVVGVVFKDIGKIYWFKPEPYSPKKNEKVVVETIRGLELGFIETETKEIPDEELEHELKPIVRIANKYDIKNYFANLEKAKKDIEICKKIVSNRGLEMKLLSCEYTLDRQKIIIYYTAEGRVDFRELLKDLASEFRVRIELRQIGPREGAKIIGGIGPCGREVCCKKFLREFDLVTMKMAKDQNMSLSASKIAGVCGKLMCCIGYENDVYCEIRKEIPLPGDIVNTPSERNCKVVGVDVLARRIKVMDKNENISEWPAKDLVKIQTHKEEVTAKDLTDDIDDE